MFTLVQPHEIHKNRLLVSQYMQLRKKVFVDKLGWTIPVNGDEEQDSYDLLGATYLFWCSDDRKRLYGALRLMPTTGPTLLHDVFHETHGRNPELIHPKIWEGTRMCVDDALIERDFPQMDCAQGFNLLFLALCESAMALGIERLVSNFDACMARIYRRAGLKFELHGRSGIYGPKTVHCASFAVTPAVLADLRHRTGVIMPVLVLSPALRPMPPCAAGHSMMAAA